MDILEELKGRGIIYQVTDYEGLRSRLGSEPTVVYAGFDPTADSLHVGNLLPILCLRRFQMRGHIPIVLVGGGTGLIGDPSGKTEERALNPKEVISEWTEKIKLQLKKFLDFDTKKNPALILDNYQWLSELKVIEFLRQIGKSFPLNYMLSKESVRSRLETGISFTEFTYMILQAYDFMKLAQDFNCRLQVGGSDQWGNITAGIDLIRKILGLQAYGITFPLVTKADGTKFGKTEAGTIWLDPQKTSPYQFYQFWMNTDDRDLIKFIKYFTFLKKEEILDLENELRQRPEKRKAQRVLAEQMVSLVHGKEKARQAEKISQALFYQDLKILSKNEIRDAFNNVPSFTIQGRRKISVVDLLVEARIFSSKSRAREGIQSGAVYINGERLKYGQRILHLEDRLQGEYLIIRRGKRNYYLIQWV